MQKKLSSTDFVQTEITRITNKRDLLDLYLSLKNYKDCAIIFTALNEIEGRGFISIRQDDFPFILEQEFKNLIEDAIETYNSDIATLEQHLNNI